MYVQQMVMVHGVLVYKHTNSFTDINELTYEVFNVPFCNNIRNTLKKTCIRKGLKKSVEVPLRSGKK